MKDRIRKIIVIDDNDSIHSDFAAILGKQKEDTSKLDALGSALFSGGDTQKAELATDNQYDLGFASQGQDGFELVKKAIADGKPYELAFVDMRMPPGWDGLETIKHIWSVDPDIQVVICTAYSDYSWEDIIAELGDTDNLLILKKPFDIIEVSQLASVLTGKWLYARMIAEKLQNLNNTIDEKSTELDQANTRREKLLQAMRSEIKCPAEGIAGLLSLTLDANLPMPISNYVSTAKSSTDVLLAIINDIEDIDNLEHGLAIKLDNADISLSDLLEHVKDLMNQLGEPKNVTFNVDIAPSVQETIFSDHTRLFQFFISTMSSMLRFTKDGDINVSVSEVADDETGIVQIYIKSDCAMSKENLDTFRNILTGEEEHSTNLDNLSAADHEALIIKMLSKILNINTSLSSQDQGTEMLITMELALPASVVTV